MPIETSTLAGAPVGAVIPVADIGRARAFYEDMLGLEGLEAPGGWELRGGGGTRLYLLEAPGDAGSAAWPLASFLATDLPATVAALRDHGVTILDVHDGERDTGPDGIARMGTLGIAWFRDLDGNVLTVFEPTPGG